MATQADIDAAFAVIRAAQVARETEIGGDLAAIVVKIDDAQKLYPGGLSKALFDLRNVANIMSTALAASGQVQTSA